MARLRDARIWLRSRGPVTLAAALLLEVSAATTPSGPHARALLRAALLGLVLFAVLLAAAVDGAVARAVVALRGASVTALAWIRTNALGHALPSPVPSSLLLDKAGRPLRGGARTARIASIERDRARRIRERSLRGRAEVAFAWISTVAGPTAQRLGRAGIALESRVLAARARTIAAARRAGPWLERTALAARARSRAISLALRAGLEPRAAAAKQLVAPLTSRLAQERAALPARAESALRSARLATVIASRSTSRALSAIPVPAIPVPTLPVRTLRVVTLGLLLSFVFATVIGTTGLVASRGSVALGASTTLGIISGEVLVNEGGSTEFRVAADGEILQAGSTVKTGPDAYAILTYFEGSTVSIDPNTVLVIESLLANPDGSTIIGMRQDVGQTWHAVTRLLTAGSKYEVRTPTATATVRGTLFLVGVVPGADPSVPETVIETTEGAVAAERAPTVETPQGEEIVVPAGFQVRAKAAEAIPPAVPAPEPERKVTVTVGAANSLVVDPQGRANGEKDGKIVVQTPGATVQKVGGQIVVTLPNTTDGKISTVVQQAAPDDDDEEAEPPAPVQVVTVVQERGRGESRTEETVQPTTQGPAVTGVEIKKGVEGDTAPPDVRRLDESEKQEAPKVKVAEAPAPPAPPVARADERPSGDRGQSPGTTGSTGQQGGDRGGSGGGEPGSAPSPSAEPKRGIVNAIVTLTLPPLSADELAKREREKREADERDRNERARRDEERRREEEQKVAELRRQEQQARAEVSRIGGEREREETRRDERREERQSEPAPSPAGVVEQIFRAVSAPGRDDDRRVNELRKAEEEAAKKAEAASEERRRAEQRLREESIRAEEEKRKEAERRAEELRRAEEKAKQDEARKLEELRRIEEKAREQAAKLEAEQRREAERRLAEFREAEERKRREEARALEEQRRAEERARDEAERRLRELRRQEEEARERERERQRERDRERDESRERGGFTPRETLKPLPGVGTRSVEEEEQRTEQLRERGDRQEAKRDAERDGGRETRDGERPDREARGRDSDG